MSNGPGGAGGKRAVCSFTVESTECGHLLAVRVKEKEMLSVTLFMT